MTPQGCIGNTCNFHCTLLLPRSVQSAFSNSVLPRFNYIIFANNQLEAQLFFMYVYFYSLHVSGSHVPIIRRINCINTSV